MGKASRRKWDDRGGGQPVGPACESAAATESPLAIIASAFSGPALWVSVALIAGNLAVFGPAAGFGFLAYDDPQYVSANPQVAAGLTWKGVSWAFSTGYFSNWHPLTWLSHMLDVQIFGMNPGAHHLTNLILHVGSTLILFGLLHSLTAALGRSAFVAALFALHPLHVESVAWVSERKDLLSTFLGMLTLAAYVGFARRPRAGRYLAVMLLYAMGLMAKPMLVTLPFVLLLLDFWPLGRLSPDAAPQGQAVEASDRSSGLGALILEKVPLFALAGASAVATFLVQRAGGNLLSTEEFPLEVRAANAVVSYVLYLSKTLWPASLAAFYPYPRAQSTLAVVGGLLALAAASVAAIRAARRHPYLAVGWLWYLGTLVPVIGLVQAGEQAMADRYTYVPLIGIFVAAAWGIPVLLARWPRPVLQGAAAFAVLACALSARAQVRHWGSDRALWTQAVRATAGNAVAHNNLGIALAAEGLEVEAQARFSDAVRLNPRHAEARNNLGASLLKQGRADEAATHLLEAIRLAPEYADARSNLGSSLASLGRPDEAIVHFSEALRLKPASASVRANLGIALAKRGRVEEGLRHLTEAVRIAPEHAEAHYNLAVLLIEQVRFEEAALHLEATLRLNPAHPEARSAIDDLRMLRGARASRRLRRSRHDQGPKPGRRSGMEHGPPWRRA